MILIVAGILFYTIQSLAWPLSPGRDFMTYMVYFFDLLNPHPVYHLLMLYRTPLTPVFWGLLLTWGQPFWAEIVMCILYVVTLMLVHYIANYWGRPVAWLASIIYLGSSAHAWLYHVASSEALFSFAYVVWIALIVRTFYRGAPVWWFVFHGLLVFLLTMIRPIAQLYVPLFVLFVLLLPQLPFSKRLIRATVFLTVIISSLLLYSSYNSMRYNDFTISRTTSFHIPFYRLFLEGAIHPENGPASRMLYSTVRTNLLENEPYRSRHIDEELFFHGESKAHRIRMLYDIVGLSDREWGWDSDYITLSRVSLEAITSRPSECARFFILSFIRMLNAKPEYPAARKMNLGRSVQNATPIKAIIDDEWIPHSFFQWTMSSPYIDPKNAIEPVTTELNQRMSAKLPQLPTRNGSELLASLINLFTVALPGIGAWVFLGLLGLIIRPHTHRRLLLFLLILTLAAPCVSFHGIDDIPEFRTIFDPVFIIVALAAIWGGRLVVGANNSNIAHWSCP